MTLKLNIPDLEMLKPIIKIFGVGGAGGNAINNMIRSKLEGVEFVAANTDAQSLTQSLAQNRIQLGVKATKGLGAGSFPDRGREAAEENIEEITSYLEGVNMVFIAAGMGGGTGTGAAPVIARLARERGILTVGVVTKPFHFEGKYRMDTALAGIKELKTCVDTLIIIPNQNLFKIANDATTFEAAFNMADAVLHDGVRGITDLMVMPGIVNLDFADIRATMTRMGAAMMGTGEADGENRAILACEAAISNPLLDDISIKGAKGVLVNITGGPDLTLFEVDTSVNVIRKEVDPNANIIFGSAFNEEMKGKIRISIVATGIDAESFDSYGIVNKALAPSRASESGMNENKKVEKRFFDPGIAARVEKLDPEKLKNAQMEFVKSSPNQEDRKRIMPNVAVDSDVDCDYHDQIEEFDALEAKIAHGHDSSMLSDNNKNPLSEIISEVDDKHNVDNISQPSEPQVKKGGEKKSGGFSLFKFMNIGKTKEEEYKEPVKNKVITPEHAKADNSKNSSSGTIFDDEDFPNRSSLAQDDDVLDIPAFLRRKK